MSSLHPLSFKQFFSAGGQPMAGAQLYNYTGNTTIPRAAYRDGAMQNIHSFPILADGNGMFPGIFILPGEYRFEVRDANGALISGLAADGLDTGAVLDGNGVLPISLGGTSANTAPSALFNIGAATQASIDALTLSVASKLPLAGGTLTGAVTILAPSADMHPATRAYADKIGTVGRAGDAFFTFLPTIPARYLTTSAQTEALFCDGRAVSRASFAALFAAIGTYYGAGDGVSTFNLPEPRGWFIRAFNNSATGKDPSRSAIGSQQFMSLQDHTHNVASSFNATGGATGIVGPQTSTNFTATGTGETRPDNLALPLCINTGLQAP